MTPPEEASAGEGRAAKVLFGKYELGRLLGCGACAKVYHARTVSTGQTVAIKVLSKSRMAKSGLTNTVKREVSIMRRLHHPHILRLLEVLASRTRVYFVLELAKGGELFSRLASRGRLPEPLARRYFQQLISAVGYCHSRGVFHRDLKPENLLLDDADNLKVSDFGLSALLPDDSDPSLVLLNTICGTPAYVAPEILAKRPYAGAAADVWSCGVILFVLAAGYLPFNDSNLMAMYRKIYRGVYRCPKWVSPELRRLIGRMLEIDPERRVTVDGIIHDPWFRKGMGGDEWAAMASFVEEEKDGEEEREMNAFDIISFSPGLDLSGMFGKEGEKERFVAAGTPEAVVAAVEELGREEGMVVRRSKGMMGGVVVEERGSGRMVVRVEVRRLTEEVVVVEVERGGAAADDGRETWTGEFWTERGGTPASGSDPGHGLGVNRVEPIG